MCLCILSIILKYAVGTCLWWYWKLTLNTHFLLDFIYFHETIDFSLTSVTSSHVQIWKIVTKIVVGIFLGCGLFLIYYYISSDRILCWQFNININLGHVKGHAFTTVHIVPKKTNYLKCNSRSSSAYLWATPNWSVPYHYYCDQAVGDNAHLVPF